MAWSVHSLGSLNLLDQTAYFVWDSSGDPDPNRVEDVVPLRTTDGAKLGYSREVETVLELHIVAMGTTIDLAKQGRLNIEATLSTARNSGLTGVPVTYVQQMSGETVPRSWYVVGGKVRPVRRFPGTGNIYSVNGLFANPAIVKLTMSKG